MSFVTHLKRGLSFLRSSSLVRTYHNVSAFPNVQVEDGISHIPVMVNEVIEAFSPEDGGVYLDMTFGAGGHSKRIGESASSLTLYCLDRDPVAYEKAVKLSKKVEYKVIPLLGKFSELDQLLKDVNMGRNSFDGILIDAGCSSMQMDDPMRGFSISKNGPLDMRMDGPRYINQPTAMDVLNVLDVHNLAKIFRTYGEERHARKIAEALFDARYLLKSINTTHELSDLIFAAVGGGERRDKLQRPAHVATKIFQALRIFVNDELNELNYALELAHSYLKPGGKFVVLTFHSLEDRIVKRHIQGIDMEEPVSHSMSQKYKNASTWHLQEEIECAQKDIWMPLYKHVLIPSLQEVTENPRSRSAKLRGAIKSST